MFKESITKKIRLPLYEGVDWNKIFFTLTGWDAAVSLFTREWIEMPASAWSKRDRLRLPLYEGVDWNAYKQRNKPALQGLPLYEGVDWNGAAQTGTQGWSVSLFTREWIEIIKSSACDSSTFVSLFTREWIEIDGAFCRCFAASGLPLYEGVDWNPTYQWMTEKPVLSPSLRGSGLKWWCVLPLFCCVSVSLFTREWIEMAENKHFLVTIWKSPSLRGSGLKFLLQFLVSLFEQSPSLRGSGLKSSRFTKHKPKASKSPSLRGSGLKFLREEKIRGMKRSPSLRGSGLKFLWCFFPCV